MAEWFAPKRYGYGAGLPVAWQGWALLGAYLALVGGTVFIFGENEPVAVLALIVPATISLIIISASTTRGGWRWRWGTKVDEPRSRRGRPRRRGSAARARRTDRNA